MRIKAWLLFIAPLLSIFILSPIFFEFLPFGNGTYSLLKKMVFAGSFLYAILFYHKMTPFIRVWLVFSILFLTFFVLESYSIYQTPFKYPHVFSKVASIFLIFMTYAFYKANPFTVRLKHIVFVILLAFTANLLLINNRLFEIAAGFFTRDRIIDSHSAYMLLLPFFYFFNRYLETRRFFHVILVIVSLLLIVLLQYRTLWVAVPIGLVINIVLLRKVYLPTKAPVLLPFIALGLLVVSILFFLLPGDDRIVATIAQNLRDILHSRSTFLADWRWAQFSHYWPYIKENLFFGLRFEGYEIPVMMLDYTDNYELSMSGNRHLFNSFYVDKMYYLGIIGLLLFTLPPFIYIYTKLVKAEQLSVQQVAIVSFVATGLLYGISYVWPLHYYALLGFALYLLDFPPQKNKGLADSTERYFIRNKIEAIT